MISIKSNREIDLMKKAGHIVALAHQEVAKHIKPGVTTYELDQIVERVIRDHGATPSFKGYGGFPGSACTSINEQVVHGIPSETVVLQDGDIIAVDIGANYKGYHGDSAWTYAVGTVSDDVLQLMNVTEESLYKGLEQATAGNRISDISHAVQTHAEQYGYGVVREFVGHGVGKQLHEDPQIPNFGKPHKGPRLKAGMTLAIEPMINMGRREVRVLEDNWTAVTIDKMPSAHYEHTILVTDGAPVILTTLAKGGI
ncbi:type I methionyl aminopeptidase [Candidatus Xianfuyuplasma coldseepsis]|uniref:Methionine aminopeptidase n=1 Tax=Candidatus Xianfuyuplasma coldseepsis TaxID=2782163 RepID=A0A7L7KQV6_9MOLU|nr:type I methionyl aminopeptidase [Xianfuyuplasma coldseepsis]QMS85200.1 type I methionyl aminopeptidase [Xianfuyuplasma coldseepsis]